MSEKTYKCPTCDKPLIQEGSIFHCDNGHAFDIAAEGYVNLLLAHKKRSKNPGDNKEMIVGRRAFLEKGYYNKLSDTVNNLVKKYLDNSNKPTILDAGCGEGYYLRRLSQSGITKNAQLYGIDISRPAVIFASKKEKNSANPISYSVGNTSQLPYLSGTFSTVLSIFSPFVSEELKRILVPSGIVIVVGAGKNHLKELADKIYEKVIPHEGNKNELKESDGFKLIHSQNLSYVINLQSESIMDLLMMTPYYWSISIKSKESLKNLTNLKVSLDFEIKVYQID
jgi:23S rRNA (guanine745-N1)-methyltransferase